MKNQKYTYDELKQLQNLSLDDKILRANQIIGVELVKHKKPVVSCSWGKASIVMTHLVLNKCENVLVMFNNTGVEYPQTYKYRDKILKLWDIKNYHENKPIKSFWQCVKEYGFPKYRQMAHQGKQRTPRCCYYCKEKPAQNFIKDNNVDLNFVGLQASESMVRRLSFFREGESFISKTYDCCIVRPLMIWRDKDIWDYHKKFSIPINPVYKLMKRNGCMPCTGFKNWETVMVKANFKMYNFVSNKMGKPLLENWCK